MTSPIELTELQVGNDTVSFGTNEDGNFEVSLAGIGSSILGSSGSTQTEDSFGLTLNQDGRIESFSLNISESRGSDTRDRVLGRRDLLDVQVSEDGLGLVVFGTGFSVFNSDNSSGASIQTPIASFGTSTESDEEGNRTTVDTFSLGVPVLEVGSRQEEQEIQNIATDTSATINTAEARVSLGPQFSLLGIDFDASVDFVLFSDQTIRLVSTEEGNDLEFIVSDSRTFGVASPLGASADLTADVESLTERIGELGNRLEDVVRFSLSTGGTVDSTSVRLEVQELINARQGLADAVIRENESAVQRTEDSIFSNSQELLMLQEVFSTIANLSTSEFNDLPAVFAPRDIQIPNGLNSQPAVPVDVGARFLAGLNLLDDNSTPVRNQWGQSN